MKSVRRIALFMIFMLIAPSIWAMSCAAACATGCAQMGMEQSSNTSGDANPCHDDAGNCSMATTCHFAFSAGLFHSTQAVAAIQDTHFVLPLSSAPHSAESPPPYKPPA